MSSITDTECPICYEEIENNKNCVTTECGHNFHCSCLMKNSAVNGFTCPLCRDIMAEEEEEEEEEEEDRDSNSDYDADNLDYYNEDANYALTSFRMFNQRLEGEDVEEEEQVDDEEEEEEVVVKPTPEYIAAKLTERGIIMEDLVRSLLIEHAEYDEDEDHDRKANQIFGAFRAIISRYQQHGNH